MSETFGRKFWMTLLAQMLGTVAAVAMAWLGLPDATVHTVLTFIGGIFGAGVAGNLYEHTTETIKAVKAAKYGVNGNGKTP